MKKRFTFFAICVTVLALLINASALSTETVKINGVEKLSLTNVADAYDVPDKEGADSHYEFACTAGAKLSFLDDKADAIVFFGSELVIPDGYSASSLNEYGQFMDIPKGSSYTFNEQGMYYYDIQFEDGTLAIGYIYIGDERATVTPIVPEEPVLPPVEEPERIPTVSKAQHLQIEEEWTDVDAYNIYDNNYIKLRDFAYYYTMFCSLTDKHFDVTWDAEKNAINLVTGKPYTAVGGEGQLNAGVAAEAVLSTSSVYLNGEHIPLTAYNINGNNYFKLRDLCEALNISISWWGVQQIIYINNDYPYGTEFEEIVPDIW